MLLSCCAGFEIANWFRGRPRAVVLVAWPLVETLLLSVLRLVDRGARRA